MAGRIALLSLLLSAWGCTGGGPGAPAVELEAAPLVVAAGSVSIPPQAQDLVSGQLDLARLGIARVDEVYELTTPADRAFVFDILSRSEANAGAVRVSVGHAADGGAPPAGGPDSMTVAGVVASAPGMTRRDSWADARGDGFARFTLRGSITRDQVFCCEADNGAGTSVALVCVRIGPESEINVAAQVSGDHPGVVEEQALYSSDSWMFGLPTIAVSGDRTSIVVYEGDQTDTFGSARYELRMQYDHATKLVTGGGSEEQSPDWGNWRDHEIAALYNVLALVRGGTERVTLKLSFDRGASFGQVEVLAGNDYPWAARLATISLAADYTLAVLYWQTHKNGATDLFLVEGRPSAVDAGGSPTRYLLDAPRLIHREAGDVMPIIMGSAWSLGGDLVIGYAFSTMVPNEFRGTTTTTSFRVAVRLFGRNAFVDRLVDQDTIVGKDPSVALLRQGNGMRVFYAYEGRQGVLLRASDDAGLTWSGPIPIGDRSAHMPTVITRGTATVDVLYLAYGEKGLELFACHWDDFDTSAPVTYRLTEATSEAISLPFPDPPPGGPVIQTVLPPGSGLRITEVAWFGYDAVRDGGDIVVVHHQRTYDGWFDPIPLGLGMPELAVPAAPGAADFRIADPPPLAPGMTEPLNPANPDESSQLIVQRVR